MCPFSAHVTSTAKHVLQCDGTGDRCSLLEIKKRLYYAKLVWLCSANMPGYEHQSFTRVAHVNTLSTDRDTIKVTEWLLSEPEAIACTSRYLDLASLFKHEC